MDLSRFVRITRDGSTTSGGTGYLLDGSLVLTARHVVEKAGSLEVFYDGRGRAATARNVKIEWEGEGDLDVAVLSVETERRLAREILESRRLGADLPWRSCGWAVVSSPAPPGSSVVDSMSRLRGTTYEFSETAQRFELGVADPPSAAKWWHGVSGAPVFCGWRLVGVIVEGKEAFEGGRLDAIPLAAVWDAPGFREAIGDAPGRAEKRTRRRSALIADVAALFGSYPKAAEAIADQDAAWRAALDRESSDGGAVELAKTLCETRSWRQVLCAFRDAQRKLLENAASSTSEIDADAIVQVVERVVPEIYGATEIQTLGDEEGGMLVTLPIESETLAEVAMAAIDGRQLAYWDVQEVYADPRGRARFVVNAKDARTDFDFKHEGALREAVYQLADKLILDTGVLAVLKQPGRFDDLARRVNKVLERDVVEHHEPRRYFLYRSQDRSAVGDFPGKLRKLLPALHVAELSATTMADELDDLDPLQSLLFRATKARKKG